MSGERSAPPPILATLYRDAVDTLTAAGIDTPALDVRVLMRELLGVPREAFFLRREARVAEVDAARFVAAVARRAAREPVSRICGWREFWSLPFRLSPETLDPRPDSETVIETVLRDVPDRSAAYRVVDLGTGSGCLLLALLSELPRAIGLGIDRSLGAVATARTNADALGLGGRSHFVVGDWTESLSGPVDIILSNPPYVVRDSIPCLEPEVRLYDPPAALDGGADGLDAYRRLAPGIVRVLGPGGLAAVEAGAGQASEIVRIFSEAGGQVAQIAPDLGGIARCLVIRK